jgi:hypothetical protein
VDLCKIGSYTRRVRDSIYITRKVFQKDPDDIFHFNHEGSGLGNTVENNL